jgi:RHH-type proline utilization regulon transcriptional repressor/proline dehydrogenase/delta 1-pyrroline-5-carboxylate dehydrogenase
MRALGCAVTRPPLPEGCARGSFVAPALIEIDRIDQLGGEVFGPVLHVLRYAQSGQDAMVDRINATGYGLTFGLHTRIDETVARITARSEAGNLYVNRNLIGAVVGSQPFGGTGLSGTGPKAGGPLILHRLRRIETTRALLQGEAPEAARRFASMLEGHPMHAAVQALVGRSPFGVERTLPGPVGERNSYALRPRGTVLCLADDENSLLLQIGACLATGNQAAIGASGDDAAGRMETVSRAVRAMPDLLSWRTARGGVSACLASGGRLVEAARAVTSDRGPLVSVFRLDTERTGLALEWLMHERSVSTNTTAAGGNASLMTLD